MSDIEDTMSEAGRLASAPPPAPKAKLKCLDPSRLREKGGGVLEIRLAGGPITIGRATSNDVVLNAEGVSKSHVRISQVSGQWQIEDLGSTNGVRINNSKLPKALLADGDNVAIGRALYKYEIEAAPAAKPAAPKIDIGDGEKTVMITRGQRDAANAAPPAGAAPATPAAAKAPAAAKPPADAAAPKPAAPKPAAARPAARKPAGKQAAGGIGIVMWIFVILGIAGLVGAVVMMLGV